MNSFKKGTNKTIDFDSFIVENKDISEENIILEVSKNTLLKKYEDLFIEYIWNYCIYNENSFRYKMMKNSLDNTKDCLKNLKINLNKTKQSNTTSEILLIVSSDDNYDK